MKKTFLAFIGGSGLYDMPGITNLREEEICTPFGNPSDKIILGEMNSKPVAFLPRHGKGHKFLPSEVNNKANIYALKKIGITHILSISAVGSLQQELAPGSAVIPSQILDMTNGRKESFFGEGVVGHVSFADPFCPQLQDVLKKSLEKEKILFHDEKTVVTIRGPRFNTRAESIMYKNLGADIVGMTAVPEAILAREAEIAYATLAFVTDYDSWRVEAEPVTVEMVMAVLKNNVETSKKVALAVHQMLPEETNNPIFNAAQHAIMTNASLIPPETKRNLDLFYGKYWS
ncbi:MAG: S-methyl-5'-thioadenosine phosphorylase [Bdellovibrionota bacterium]